MLEIEILEIETIKELGPAWMISYFAIDVLHTLKNIQSMLIWETGDRSLYFSCYKGHSYSKIWACMWHQ
jgi:hypothetical protein